MSQEVFIPTIGYSMNEALLVKWFVNEGDKVKEGDSLAEIETEKTVTEVLAPTDGIIQNLSFSEGEYIAPGKPICLIGDGLETEPKDKISQLSKTPNIKEEQGFCATAPEPKPMREIFKASPVARKLALDKGLDINVIRGTGPGGRVVRNDVLAYEGNRSPLVVAAPEESHYKTISLSPTRRTIAEKMVRSRQEIPTVTTFIQIDITDLLQKRNTYSDKPSLTAIIAYGAIQNLKDFPLLNSNYIDNEFRQFEEINLGVATETERGLVVPVIKNSGKIDVLTLTHTIRNNRDKAEQKKLQVSEMSGSTFTITNSGVYGSSFFTPIINPPEVAILGIGNSQKQLMFRGSSIIEGRVLTLCMSYDHRFIDGSYAVRFLAKIKEMLEGFSNLN